MTIFTSEARDFAHAVSHIVTCNPFVPERIRLEREALGGDFTEVDAVWHLSPENEETEENVERICRRAQTVADGVRERLAGRKGASAQELTLYEDLVLFLLYHLFRSDFHAVIVNPSPKFSFYPKFLERYEHYFDVTPTTGPRPDPAHHFAIFFQVRRAFNHIFHHLAGSSLAAAQLRAQVWQSIFTHDIRRYRRVLFDRMRDISTLITGPSGTGKELVARAVGLSRYIPFDPAAQSFVEDYTGSFYVLNLSALSPTLIESELFGHRKGSFTGATDDRPGWLEICPPRGTVFIDEIGEIEASIQVKLLRVLQDRTFQRLGDTETRHFGGKVITATNRDLAQEMREGRFREDLYYRLCSDIIVTPSLAEQLRENPEELTHLIRFIAQRVVDGEAEALTEEVVAWIEEKLEPGYSWPGNFRELEQCVRNVLVRREYHPSAAPPATARRELSDGVLGGKLTADDVLRRYTTLVYAETGNYEETARRLGIDRRTVKAKIDPEFLERLQNRG